MPDDDAPGKAAKPTAVSEVFLSSTVLDLEDYRKAARQAITNQAKVKCHLSEDWHENYVDTLDECRKRVEATDGYFGVFGHYYGTVVPDEALSITHLEFRWARDRWTVTHPVNMAIFMPEKGSVADVELDELAQRVLLERRNAGTITSEEEAKHPERLGEFHREVGGGERKRFICTFRSLDDLAGSLAVKVVTWKNVLLEARHAMRDTPAREVSRADLGRLGRAPVGRAIEEAVASLALRADVPAAGFLLLGHEDSGHREVLDWLSTHPPLKRGRRSRKGRLPVGGFGLDVLVSWLARMAGGAATDVATLAEVLAADLRNGQLTILLDRVHDLAGGMTAFQRDLWQPLVQQLTRLRAERKLTHRLVLVVADCSGAEPGTAATHPHDTDPATADYGRLLVLPPLTDIKPIDVLGWLEAMEVPDDPPGRRAEIVGAALTNVAGKPDGTPRRVYDRLLNEDLWNDD